MKSTIIAVSVVCVAIIAAALFYATQNRGGGIRLVAMSDSYNQRVEKSYWAEGNTTNPKIRLTEYCDFQSQACAAFFSLIDSAFRAHSTEMELDWHSFPLQSKNNNAVLVAEAAEAAGRQGKFWNMHQLLFVNQATLAGKDPASVRESLITFAGSIGLNVDQFKSDLDDTSIIDPINKDLALGNAVPLASTPGLLLNGKLVTPLPSNAAQMNAFIQSTLDAAH